MHRNRKCTRFAPSPIVLVALAIVCGCAKDDVEEARQRMAQTGGADPHASAPGSAVTPAPPAAPGSTDGQPVPLKQTGVGSVAELQRELPKLADATAAASFERAYRLTFTADPAQRDYATARTLLNDLLATQPRFAPAYRTLAYVEFNLNPNDSQTPLAHYGKAVELDPEYGEAHYAIAFMCAATGDRTRGVEHYRKAMALGVADERNIGQRFYADLLAPN